MNVTRLTSKYSSTTNYSYIRICWTLKLRLYHSEDITITKETSSTTNHLMNPDMAPYYELLSQKSFRHHYIAKSTNPSTALYCVTTSVPWRMNKASLTLHRGKEKDGPVLGVVKLGRREHIIGVGDPDNMGGFTTAPVVWEKVRRSSTWRYKNYEVEYDNGSHGRKKYTWQWVQRGLMGYPTALELRAGSPNALGNEILAVYKRKYFKNLKSGIFHIHGDIEQTGDRGSKEWEVFVLLSALAILEEKRRRD